MSVRRIPVIPALAGVGVALFLFLLLPTSKLPLPLVGLFAGGSVEQIDIEGGSVVDVRVGSDDPRVVQAIAAELRARAERIGAGAHAVVDGSRIHFGLLKHEPEVAEFRVESLLQEARSLELKLVDDDAPFMRELAARFERDGAAVEVDSWDHFESGQRFSDVFVTAPSPGELRELLAGVVPEPGRELAIERLPDGSARSYYLRTDAVVDHTNVVRADVIYSEYTGQPEVLVTFDDAGGRRFGEVTGDNVGRKIAIVLDGEIVSAPVIQTRIPGGRITITLGGASSAEELLRDAEDLAAALGAKPLPAPVEIAGVAANPAWVSSTALQLARIALALLVGLLFFGAAFAVGRAVAPREPLAEARAVRGSAGRRSLPWLRLAVTVAAPAAVIVAGSRWLLPNLDEVEVQNLLHAGGGTGDGAAQLGVLALGLMPVLSAFVLVELVALAVPRWRPLRETASGRLRLGVAAMALGAALALFQGWMLAVWIEGITAGGPWGISIVAPDAVGFRAVTALTLTGGTFCLVVVAWLVTRFGLGNGFSVLLGTGLVVQGRDLWRALRMLSPPPAVLLGLLVGAGAVVLATVWVLRARAGGKRLPAGGLVPIGWGSGVVQLITTLAWLGVLVPIGWLEVLAPSSASGFAIYVALLVALSAACSWLFSRVGPLHPANLASTGYLLLLGGAHFALLRWAPHVYVDLLTLAVGTAILLDLSDEWRARARHGELVWVRDLHRVQDVDAALAALRDAGIPAHARGAAHRALLHFFGPFIPIALHVPHDRAADAGHALAD